MPGYEKCRFVDLSARESDELECRICFEILREPLVTACCLQAFCRQCIHQWLRTSGHCPNDRQPLSPNQLCPSPRLLTNMINRLKTRCPNQRYGCPAILELGAIGDHAKRCPHSPTVERVCRRCGLEAETDGEGVHDCAQRLSALNAGLVERLERYARKKGELKLANRALRREAAELRTENENLVKQFEAIREDVRALRNANLTKEVEMVRLRDEFDILVGLFGASGERGESLAVPLSSQHRTNEKMSGEMVARKEAIGLRRQQDVFMLEAVFNEAIKKCAII